MQQYVKFLLVGIKADDKGFLSFNPYKSTNRNLHSENFPWKIFPVEFSCNFQERLHRVVMALVLAQSGS